jgi:hypothetical protein
MRRRTAVVHKCANSSCENPFLYFRSGTIFQFPRPEKRLMESFWLCGRCSQGMTLQWNESVGVVVTQKSRFAGVSSD